MPPLVLVPVDLTARTIVVFAVLALVAAAVAHRWRDVLLRGIPTLSARAVGLFRIAFGLTLLWLMVRHLRLPGGPAPGGPASESMLWERWGWVGELTVDVGLRDALYAATIVALVLFTMGLLSRVAYAAAALGVVVRLLVSQEYGIGGHAWVIVPFVLAPLVIVPWGDALSMDAAVRRLRGRPTAARDPGPRYGVAVWLPGLVLGVAWGAAGMAKLFTSGVDWVTTGAVRYHWIEDLGAAKVDWGRWIAGQEWLAIALSGAGIAIELLFFTHLLVRSEWVRLAYGVAAAGLLTGFYLFQGVLWPAWWAVLLAFVPWEALARGLGGEARAGTVRAPLSSRRAAVVCAIAASIGIQQVAVSRANVEQMPFFSNFPMYGYTFASPAAFNERIAPYKFYVYRYLREGDQPRDITAELTDAGARDLLRDVVAHRIRHPDAPLDAALRAKLASGRMLFRRRHGEDLTRVRVDPRPRVYDFEARRIVPRSGGRDLVLDLERLTVTPAP